MPVPVEDVIRTILIGIGATLIMDLWGVLAARLFAFPAPNYGLVGRWIGHMRRGRFVHPAIARAEPVSGELWLGWTAHYATGIAFAGLLSAAVGLAWTRHPTLFPALLAGWATLAAPFLLMQPGMGLGLASSRAPNPSYARLRSFLTHSAFGVGLYLAAVAINGAA